MKTAICDTNTFEDQLLYLMLDRQLTYYNSQFLLISEMPGQEPPTGGGLPIESANASVATSPREQVPKRNYRTKLISTMTLFFLRTVIRDGT